MTVWQSVRRFETGNCLDEILAQVRVPAAMQALTVEAVREAAAAVNYEPPPPAAPEEDVGTLADFI